MTLQNIIVNGVALSGGQLSAVLRQMPKAGFSKSKFAGDLVKQGLTAAKQGDFVRRLMQHLKQSGLIDYDSAAQHWLLTDLGRMRAGKTLRMVKPLLPKICSFDHFIEASRMLLCSIACLGLIGVLITLNASFAWELGREAGHFRAAFVVGLMALDLMRPFLVAAGIELAMQKRTMMAALGFAVAFALAPVSVLSSTAILSSSFLLGAEMNTDGATQAATLEALRQEHTRLLAEAEQVQAAWMTECARGGCGPIARELETAFSEVTKDAQDALDQIITLTESSFGASELLARMVTTFEQLGVFDTDRQIWLPLFLALSLELGALFGPALLFAQRKP